MARLVAMVGFRVGAYPAAQPGPQSCGMINVGLFAAKRTNGSTFDEKARRISKGQKFSRACEWKSEGSVVVGWLLTGSFKLCLKVKDSERSLRKGVRKNKIHP